LNFEVAQYYHDVLVWSVNNEYPQQIEIDTRTVSFDKPFRFRDLDMHLPEGMWLHRKYDREYNNAIIGMTENWNHVLTSTLFPTPEEEEGEGKKEEEDQMLSMGKVMLDEQEAAKKKKVKSKKDMPLILASSKKIMQLKNAGADNKAFKESLKKGDKGDKDKKKK
jgi:hypothetical protein